METTVWGAQLLIDFTQKLQLGIKISGNNEPLVIFQVENRGGAEAG